MERKWLALLSVLVLLCAGCSRYDLSESHRVVTEIQVICPSDRTQKSYTDPEKMRHILNSLRQIGQLTTPDQDPETLPLGQHQILLTHSDGTKQTWYTKGDRYIRQGNSPWQQADPDLLTQLTHLFQIIPSDR